MNPTALLLATFPLSITGLFAFIWSLRNGLFDIESTGARIIFCSGEIGLPEEPSASAEQRRRLEEVTAVHAQPAQGMASSEAAVPEAADRSSAFPAFDVQSVMMIIPVIAFSLNQHLTLKGALALSGTRTCCASSSSARSCTCWPRCRARWRRCDH